VIIITMTPEGDNHNNDTGTYVVFWRVFVYVCAHDCVLISFEDKHIQLSKCGSSSLIKIICLSEYIYI
jgi:hypothetical protein